jgi:subtilisin family serine protease
MSTILRLSRLSLILSLIFSGVLFGCAPATSETSTPATTEAIKPTHAEEVPEEQPGQTYQEVNGYVPGMIIFTGFPDDIQRVVNELANKEIVRLEIPIRHNADDYNVSLPPCLGQNKEIYPVVEVRTYDLASSPSIWEIIRQANSIASSNPNNPLFAIAEPNFAITVPGAGYINGQPVYPPIGGGPIGDSVALGTNTKYFLNQWALLPGNGINAKNTNGFVSTSTTQATGDGVNVAVFDSIPESFPETSQLVTITMQNSISISIRVEPFLTRFNDLVVYQTRSGRNLHMDEHGLFVTSMSYAVAKDSNYYLYEVLNRDLQGSLDILIFALIGYLNSLDPDQVGIVNLSLGMQLNNIGHLPAAEQSIAKDANVSINRLVELLTVNRKSCCLQVNGDDEIFSYYALQTALSYCDQCKHVVVAAAGNFGEGNPPLYPAGYETVIGVASSDENGDQSCFSNDGDVFAPSGNGIFNPPNYCDVDIPTQCRDNNSIANSLVPNCTQALIGIITDDQSGGHQLAYWMGTSFSTPLVSGLGAQIYSEDIAQLPLDVRRLIVTHVNPKNIIDVELTVGNVPTPTP